MDPLIIRNLIIENTIYSIVIVLFLLIASPSSYSIENKNISNQDLIQFEQKQWLESAQRQRQNLKQKPRIASDNPILISDDENRCFTIESINLTGMTVFSDKQKNKLIENYLDNCLTINNIQSITQLIQNYYVKKGYVTVQVSLPEQDLTLKTLTILIIEGIIESIEIQNSPTRTVNMIYPNLIGGILNLRDIEQGLEQLNRLNSYHYSIDIQAGSKTGLSHLFIYRKGKKIPLATQLQLDNSGSKSNGEKQLNAGLIFDSLLGLGEQWSVSGNSDTDFSTTHFNHHYILGLNVPYGNWNYRYHLFNSRSFQTDKVDYQSFDYEVKNSNQYVEVSRLIYRDAKQRVLVHGGFENKRVRIKFMEQLIDISSPILTSIIFTAQYNTVLSHGYFTFSPTFKQGINAFGASPNINVDDYPRSHFNKLSLNSSYQYFFSPKLSFLTSFHGQITRDNLYSVEQIHLGGQYSVRGFKAQMLSGNQGFYWRNDINYLLPKPIIGALTLVGAWDLGYQAKGDEFISGGAIGINFNHKSGINSQLIASIPFYYPKNYQPDHWSLYWSVSLSL